MPLMYGSYSGSYGSLWKPNFQNGEMYMTFIYILMLVLLTPSDAYMRQ